MVTVCKSGASLRVKGVVCMVKRVHLLCGWYIDKLERQQGKAERVKKILLYLLRRELSIHGSGGAAAGREGLQEMLTTGPLEKLTTMDYTGIESLIVSE